MPFLQVNGSNLYYETFGKKQKNSVPIVLIHGSTSTGRHDWQMVAPLLGREYYVIVPDCRGHGQSSNPQQTYSFKEMAADTAALIRALGYQRAHLIGHSNGGNVVLVALLEHPEVVASCIPQAANAYVSQDLIEKEPAIFDPARVARQAPQWVEEMQKLHSATHGTDYWRTLIRLTGEEIVSYPNYTPAELAKVNLPTLVVQGEKDNVNAPAGHAQFIAQHIPAAELWIPPGIGHNVHLELPVLWVERVLDFLARRGDEANDALYRLRQAHYGDNREAIFNIRAHPSAKGLRLSGSVLTEAQHQAALNCLPTPPTSDQVRILLTEESPSAHFNRPVTDVRGKASHGAERVTQGLIGDAVRILEEEGQWARIRLERDGYLGWVPTQALIRSNNPPQPASHQMLVLSPLAPAFIEPSAEGTRAGLLPFGACLPLSEENGEQENGEWAALRLPAGSIWWVEQAHLLPITKRPQPNSIGIAATLRLIDHFIGVPYLWGGSSPFGYDCSGFSQAFWHFMGVNLPRDADQQFSAGSPVHQTPQPGDLLFFGNSEARITHVAISLGADEMIHATQSAGGVTINSLQPSSPLYNAWLAEYLVGVRRFALSN